LQEAASVKYTLGDNQSRSNPRDSLARLVQVGPGTSEFDQGHSPSGICWCGDSHLDLTIVEESLKLFIGSDID
jgi:hypothetical protein